MRILVPFAVLLHSVTVSGRLCNQAVGIQNGTIPDQAFTASSSFNKWHGPHQARLNNVKTSKGEGAWCSNTTQVGEYIQVDLGRVRLLSKIATQGRNTTYSLYVSKYILHYSPNGIAYNVFPNVFGSQEAKVFDANKDKNTIVYNDLMLRHEPLQARYVRLFPQAFNGKMCLRLELYECIGGRCTVNNGGCSHNCSEPSPGIVVCQCPLGYKLLPLGKICQDVNECAEEHGCNGTCVNTVGSYRCECSHGMKLGNDGKSCLDINECLPDKNPCDSRSTICENEIGSYKCKCKQGFKSTWNKHICKDIDECDLGTDLCDRQSTKCRNVIGSYKCDCRPGLKKKPVTAHRCHDIDECSLNNGGCSHNCTNTFGSFRCICPTGYLISAGNSKKCVDRNECLAGNGGCEWLCNNTVGSYQCSCLHGYELAADRHKCNDIDECSKNMDKCDRNSTKCNNFVGGYQCDCKTGYKYVIGNKYKCQLRDCPPLVLSEGTAVSPQTCLQAKVMKVGSTCKFSCKTGFRLPSDKNTLTCLSSGHWDAANIACQRIKCPPLAAPANGNLYPSSCKSTGAKYQGNCYYSCSQGFVLSGVSKKTCLQDSNWDSLQNPTCTRSYDKPWITCPSNVITTLPPGAKESDVTLLLGSARSNYQKNIKMFPLIYNGNLVFRVGKTKLYFVANNPAGETANCSIVINILDKEAPKVVSYPSNQYLLAKGHDVVATWETPKFSDNVGVVRVTSTKNSGDRFSIGSTTVHITAYDEAGNSISVSFEIRITRAKCPELAKHENGNLTCIEFPMFKYCYITCTNNKKPFSITPGSSCSTTSMVWDPPLPDCVGYVNQTAGVCPKGKVPQSATISFPPVEKICVSCPKGMYYREQNKTCVKCPIGFISTAEESLACTKCPDGYSTMATGSRTCTALCKPGSASPDGFNRYDIQKPCYLCIIGFYQNEEGSTSCKRCPNGSTTLFPGAKSASTCGGPPSITLFGPRYVNVTEKNQFSFECRASGSPHPVFNVTKLKEPPPGYGGPRKIEHINEGGIQVGLRFTIFSALEHDNGVYACQASNTFGSDIKYLQVNVKLHIIHGRRKKRDYKRL